MSLISKKTSLTIYVLQLKNHILRVYVLVVVLHTNKKQTQHV